MGTFEHQTADLRRKIAGSGLSPRKLAELADLGSDNTVRGYQRDDWNPTLDTLRKIEAALAKHTPAPSGQAAA